jgi:photosystem II stability/assembly factor-like uncharacterized protein
MRRHVPAAVSVLLALLTLPAALAAQLTTPLDEDILEEFRWRSIGPSNMGGRVTDVEGLPSPSKTFYVAAASGGVWKTTNNGTTFRPLWTEERVVAMGDLAIAPSDPEQVWAGTGEEDSRNSISPGGGVFKSTDGGMTWELKGLQETQVIGRIVVHPENPDVVFVAALGHIWGANPERGLYRTTDGGETWEQVKFVSDRAGFVDVIFRPGDPEVLFASSWERVRGPWFLNSGGPGSALWKSTDGGDTWTEVVGNGFPETLKGRIGLDISRSNPDVMYAMVEAEDPEGEEDAATPAESEEGEEAEEDSGVEPGGSGLYRSEDGGETWTKMNDANSRPFYYSQVRVDPQDPDRVYFSSTPLLYSENGGETAMQTTVGVHVDHHAMWIDPNDPDRIVVGNDGGVAITFDKGGNWAEINHMALGQFYHVSYNMEVPYRVCGGLQDNYTWCSPSRVATGRLSRYHWASINGGDGFYTAQDPEDPDIVWSESQGGNMSRGNLSTGERTNITPRGWEAVWTPYQDTVVTLLAEGMSEDDPRIADLRARASADSARYVMRFNWSTPFFQSEHDRTHFYAGANMVLKSTDFGDDLEPISPDLSYADAEKIDISINTTGGITVDNTGAETHATIVSLAESPLVQGMLFAGTDDGRVWMSPDDGGEWVELTGRFPGVPEGTYVSRIEPSHHDPDRFYVAFDGHRTNDFTPYVYVTDDGGGTFRSIASDLPTGAPDFVHVIREDDRNEHLLFVGTDLGVYVSTDRGGSWQRFMEGLPTVPVHDLKIHPRDRELIAGTHGRSIWIVDIAPLQEMTDEVMADGMAVFEPTPAFQWGQEARGGEFNAQQWWSRPTPGPGGAIQYWLSEEAADAIVEGTEGETRGQRRAAARVHLTVTGPDGEELRTLEGPATDGLHTVRWDLKEAAPDRAALSPWERQDSIRVAERAVVVRDSMIAAGMPEQPMTRMVGIFTGETDIAAMMEAFSGGGGLGGNPEAFRERPGEGPAGGGMDIGLITTLSDLIFPGVDMGTLQRRYTATQGQAPMVEPGTYTVTVQAGERTFTHELTVERIGDVTGRSTPFEETWKRRKR